MESSTLRDVVLTTFRSAVEFLPTEFAVMPLDRWNESVFRYFFCRFVAEAYPEVGQLVECDRIDLVLRRAPEIAFVEFKWYMHHPRLDPYDGSRRGFKGGPSARNLREFGDCIDQLHERRAAPGLSKYVVLVYVDAEGAHRPYGDDYDAYRHRDESVPVRLVEDLGPVDVGEGSLRAQVYEVP